MLDRRHTQAFLLLGLVMVLWAGNSIVARAALAPNLAQATASSLRGGGADEAIQGGGQPLSMASLRSQ